MCASESEWRILCIDDDPDVLAIVSTTLGMKHEVLTAADGMEAVGMLEFCDADFIICDVRMPHMDGFQTVEAIRRHPDYERIPVFFLTAERGGEMAKHGFEVGANLYLTKPFDPVRLLSNVDYFLSESQHRPRSKRLTADEVAKRASGAPAPAPAPTTAPAESADTGAGAATPRVIILCSHDQQLSRVRGALEDQFECVPCADPMASMQKLFSYEPDLLVMNPAVPGLSGWGLVQMIRQNKQLRTLPIILLDDREKPIDQRLASAITKAPVLEPGASGKDVLEAVTRATRDPGFRARAKSATLAELMAAEESRRAEMQAVREQEKKRQEMIRKRYSKIQEFIDANM